MDTILKGTIFITDSLDFIYNAKLDGRTKIISLDEDDILMDSKDIIGGTCLLPPIEAKIAEADGNEQLYDSIYCNHLLLPFQQQFVAALISFLYKGGNLILFLPEIGYNNTSNKLVEHLYRVFGIHPGIVGDKNPQNANCYYDATCIPIWLNLIFGVGAISAYEYLYKYPEDAVLSNNEIMNQLILQINPYGESIQDKINYIERFRRLIHKNPRVVPAIGCLEV